MKEAKVIIPVIVLTLLVACLAATFTWFSSQKQTEIGGNINVAVNHDVFFVPDNADFMDAQDPYSGEMGYSKAIENADGSITGGSIYEGGDRPYNFKFDVSVKAQASGNALLNFGCRHISVKFENTNSTYGEIARLVFGDKDENIVVPPEREADREAYIEEYYRLKYGALYAKASIGETTDYYYRKNGTKMLQITDTMNTQIDTFSALDIDKNRDAEGYIVKEDENGAHLKEETKNIVYVVIKEQYVCKYFDLKYGKYVKPNENDPAKVTGYEPFTKGALLDFVKNEVAFDKEEVKSPAKFEIFVRFCKVIQQPNEVTPDGKYSTFTFSDDLFQNAKFRFMFKLSLEDA